MKFCRILTRFLREEDGPTAVEYAVMIAGILVTCLATIALLAQATRDSFDSSYDAIISAFN